MKKQALLFVSLLIIVLSSGCGGKSNTPPKPQPAQAILNGVTRLNRYAGSAEFSVSALDSQGNLFVSGRISDVSATTNTPGYFVSGSVCGSGLIQAKGAITTTIVLDGSGSMDDNDRFHMRNGAAKAFVARMSGSDVAAIASFNHSHKIPLWQDFTSNKSLLYAGIDKATTASGGTNLWGAAYASINYLAAASGRNKVAVILTDGKDTVHSVSPSRIISMANANNVKLFMIGLGDESKINVRDMTDVASGTNGFYRNVNDSSGLNTLFNAALNASKAAGCIRLTFQPVPQSGRTIIGQLNFSINGKAFTSAYFVSF